MSALYNYRWMRVVVVVVEGGERERKMCMFVFACVYVSVRDDKIVVGESLNIEKEEKSKRKSVLCLPRQTHATAVATESCNWGIVGAPRAAGAGGRGGGP